MGLQTEYKTKIRAELKEKLGYKSDMEVPKVVKVTLNMGVGEATADKKVLEFALGDMELIAGQKPVTTISRRSEAGFKIREGWPIGCKVTLRRKKMYEFLERFVNIVCPKIRDFKGFTIKSCDGQGNFNIGIKEQIVFSEIRYDKIDKIRGLNISITTTAKTNRDCYELLKSLNFPFIDKPKPAEEK